MPTIQAVVQLLYTEQPTPPLELGRLEGLEWVEQTTQPEQAALWVLQQQAQEDSVFLMVSLAEYFSRQGKEPTTPQGSQGLAVVAALLQVEFLQEVVATQAALAGQVALLVVALALGQPLAALVVSAVSSSSGFKVKGQT